MPFDFIHVEGITHITQEDIRCGQELGYTLKLLAIAKRDGMRVEAHVNPTFIPNNHPMANVSDAFNAVYLQGHACGEMMFMGRGAGDMPTASAIVSDLLRPLPRPCIATRPLLPTRPMPTGCRKMTTGAAPSMCAPWLSTRRRSERVAATFADHGVSIAAMQQKGEKRNGRIPMVFITHRAYEKDMQQAVREIDPAIAQVESLIRVEG